MRRLERREDVKVIDIHPANIVVASAVIKNVVLGSLNKNYKLQRRIYPDSFPSPPTPGLG